MSSPIVSSSYRKFLSLSNVAKLYSRSPSIPRNFIATTPSIEGFHSLTLHSPVTYTSRVSAALPFNITRLFSRGFSTSGPESKSISWEDHEDIADLLFEEFSDLNPLSLRFTELHEMVQGVVRSRLSLEVSGECSESALERIQMAWLDLYEAD